MNVFQESTRRWGIECFGKRIALDTTERSLRFIEESIELVQARGLEKSEVLKLVESVYAKEPGVEMQEVGGVMVTLALLCESSLIDMWKCGLVELRRCWEVMDKIREKHKTKKSRIPTDEEFTQALQEKVKDA